MDTEGTKTRRTRRFSGINSEHVRMDLTNKCNNKLRVLRVSVSSVFFPANPERSHPR